MPIDDGTPNVSDHLWAARRIIAQHEGVDEWTAGRCAQCPESGECPQLSWAQVVVEAAGSR